MQNVRENEYMSRRVASNFSPERTQATNKHVCEWEYLLVITLVQLDPRGDQQFVRYEVKCVENEVSEKFHVFNYYSHSTKNHTKRSTPSYSQENTLSSHVHQPWENSAVRDLSTRRTTSRSLTALTVQRAERNEPRPETQEGV